ncbi:flagellar biosynthetic protein FliP, partial [Candidatus Margulisiibacteriota bacterium]
MTPTFQEINETAIKPFNAGKITQKTAFTRGIVPIKKFMIHQTRDRDITLFGKYSKLKLDITSKEELPLQIIIPAFIISELKTAFQMGFLIFLPFVVVDMVVANVLLSLGMFMLSPVIISLPFKVLLFVLSDGWNIIIEGLIRSFR